jgi:hypothetical protein
MQDAKQNKGSEDYDYDQDSSNQGDSHCSYSHATVAPQFFSGHRNPFTHPSIKLVLMSSGSIQKWRPHLGHLSR